MKNFQIDIREIKSEITCIDLDGVNVYVCAGQGPTGSRKFTPNEVNALFDFVQHGGTLLADAEHTEILRKVCDIEVGSLTT